VCATALSIPVRALTLPPGEHHVFRFNNPEEIRKKRDRAEQRSKLSLSISAADLEAGTESPALPDSPASSTGPGDVDWSYARREAALAKLGMDPTLDNLPDEDLNKLFDKITKVKTMRDHTKSRPESSLSVTDNDFWSENGRPVPSELTDDTSVDAAPPSHGSPEMEAAQNQLESRLTAIAEAGEADDLKAGEAEDLKVEKEHMERQMRMVRAQMKRILDARARGENVDELETFEPTLYSARQLRMIRKVLDKWRAHRSFSMAETVLSNAVLVKEANVIRCVAAASACFMPF
jgi:kinesin family member 1